MGQTKNGTVHGIPDSEQTTAYYLLGLLGDFEGVILPFERLAEYGSAVVIEANKFTIFRDGDVEVEPYSVIKRNTCVKLPIQCRKPLAEAKLKYTRPSVPPTLYLTNSDGAVFGFRKRAKLGKDGNWDLMNFTSGPKEFGVKDKESKCLPQTFCVGCSI